MKKPRADSVLKTLHPIKQQQLFQMLLTTDYAAVVTWIKKEWQIESSATALHRFYSWYPFSRQLEEHSELKKELMATLRDLPHLDLSDEQISKAMQVMFENKAARAQDAKLFLALRKLRQKDRDQAATERKISLLEKKAAQADKAEAVANDKTLSAEQQAARLREIFKK